MATCPSCKRRFPDDVEVCDQDGMVLLPDQAVASAEADLQPGTMVGEYRIERQLGQGGFGTVYSAVHPLIGKKAAVKVLSRACSTNPEMVSRFIAEARSVNTIEHDNIIDVFSFGTLELDGRHYFVMELLEGLSFDRYLAAGGPLEPGLLLHLMSGVTQALAAAHSKSIIHRDLKPDNVFIAVDSDGRPKPKLLDFGIAKLLGDTTSGHKTRSGVPVGTPVYMSPEQCMGEKTDHRADIYSFGAMCFEALTGKPPFEGNSMLSLLSQHTSAERPKVSAVRPELGDCFDDALRTMMAIAPDGRPQTITAAFELLRDAAVRAGVDPDGEVKLNRSQVSRGAASIRVSVDGAATPEEISQADTVADSTGASGAEGITGAPTSRAPGRGSRSRPYWIVLAVAVAAASVYLVAPALTSTEPAGPPVPPSAPASPAATTEPAPTPATPTLTPSTTAPAPETVSLTVEVNVAGAVVRLEGNELGKPPGPFLINKSDQEQQLIVKAAGYQVAKRKITPNADLTEKIVMVPFKEATDPQVAW